MGHAEVDSELVLAHQTIVCQLLLLFLISKIK